MLLNLRTLLFALSLIATAGGLFAAFSLINPTPPSRVIMSTGTAGSAYEQYARRYREHLARDGIELVLQESDGSQENLERLMAADGETSVAFTTMGSPDSAAAAAAGTESLGMMFFEPLWVFTSDPALATGDLRTLPQKRISIGPPGSRSNTASRHMLDLLGFETSAISFVDVAPAELHSAFRAGSIDAAFVVASASTESVRRLLADRQVRLIDFERASAYTALYPELTGLSVPAGVGDLAQNLPPEDVNILAFTAILATRADLHPAIQSLLLDAAAEIHSPPDLFHANGRFPMAEAFQIPLSGTAERFYKSGQPFLQRYLPFWLAVLVMQLLVAALPLVGIFYPALKLIPKFFNWVMQRRVTRLYGELRRLEKLALNGDSDSARIVIGQLEELERRVRDLRVPLTFSSMVFALRSHINVVRAKVVTAAENQGKPST